MDQSNSIDLYLWQPDLSGCHFQQSTAYISPLSPSERDILNNISSNRRKEEYIAGHYFIRKIASSYCQHPLEIIHKPSQAPYFNLAANMENDESQPSAPLFNLSHSNNTIACCISNTWQTGIDIEYQKERKNLLAIAQHYFTEQEWQQLNRLQPADQMPCFYRLWTLKESYLKAQPHHNHAEMLSTTFSQQNQQNQWQCLYAQPLSGFHLSICVPTHQALEINVFLTSEHHAKSLPIQWQRFYPN